MQDNPLTYSNYKSLLANYTLNDDANDLFVSLVDAESEYDASQSDETELVTETLDTIWRFIVALQPQIANQIQESTLPKPKNNQNPHIQQDKPKHEDSTLFSHATKKPSDIAPENSYKTVRASENNTEVLEVAKSKDKELEPFLETFGKERKVIKTSSKVIVDLSKFNNWNKISHFMYELDKLDIEAKTYSEKLKKYGFNRFWTEKIMPYKGERNVSKGALQQFVSAIEAIENIDNVEIIY